MSDLSQELEQMGTPKHSTEFSEALKQEMALTAETLNEPLSDMKIVGYLEALSNPVMRVEQIRMGFRRARRTLKWFPKPSEIRELAAIEADGIPVARKLAEHNYEPMSNADREHMKEQLRQVADRLGIKKYEAPSEAEIGERKKALRKQAKQILRKA